GQNNVGKSTFLAAYDFFYKDKTPIIDDFYKKSLSSEMEFELQLGVDEVDLEYIKEKQEKKFESFKKYLSNNSLIKIKRKFKLTIEKEKPKI
ncbi:hypothetical protein, partial [Pseudomonas aeruginosa]|uniref:hypothetical protein n=1 Tax=Pseudomonas aeruginosa TaxID=287 RepID=UPI002B40941A